MLRAYIKICKVVLLLSFSGLLLAANTNGYFKEGVDYTKIPDKMRDSQDVAQTIAADPGKVQVLFFFSYGCHGCDAFHAPFDAWIKDQYKKPHNKVVVYPFPVSFNQPWTMLAKLYYVMDTLDPNHSLNGAIFNAVHKQGLKMWQESVMKKFFMQHGYTAQQFDDAYKSFNVSRMVKRADELSKVYAIATTPVIVVNGPRASYKVEFNKVNTSATKLLSVLDYLVTRESKLVSTQ